MHPNSSNLFFSIDLFKKLKNTTSKKINIPDELKKSVNPIVDKNKPSVLIFHTHTTETYELLDRGFYSNARGPRSENPKENMIRVHHTGIFFKVTEYSEDIKSEIEFRDYIEQINN